MTALTVENLIAFRKQSEITGKSYKQDPQQLYDLFGTLVSTLNFIAFTTFIWFKKRKIVDICNAYYNFCVKIGNVSKKVGKIELLLYGNYV